MVTTYIPEALKRIVAEQAKHRCGYCLTQEDLSGYNLEYDHIIPKSLGGQTIEENLWLACSECNDAKNKRIALNLKNGESVSFFNPRTQSWNEHFAWSENGAIVVGLTATGEATVIALHLNRPKLVKARKRWVYWGDHPPKD